MTRMLLLVSITCGTLFCFHTASWAQFTAFEDLTPATNYLPGSTITSNGLSFDVVDFPDGSNVGVGTFGNAGGSGNELFLGDQIGLDFQLPGQTSLISFLFGDYYIANTGLVINGEATTNNTGLAPLNGTMLGGVSIAVTGDVVPGGIQGRVILSGAIDSLIVGGTEFAIDNVLVVVPEPASVVLALVGLTTGGLLARRKIAR